MKVLFRSWLDKSSHGQTYPFIDAASKGRRYKVVSLESENYPLFLESLGDRVILASANEDKIIAALSEDEPTRWGKWHRAAGFKFHHGTKTLKRLSQLVRPFLITADLPAADLVVEVVHDDDKSKTTDGVIAISRKRFQAIYLANLARMSEKQDEEGLQAMEQFKGCMSYNSRLFLPACKGLDKEGVVKGQMFLADLPDGVDFRFHANALKPEVTLSGERAYLGMDPQPGKLHATTGKSIAWNHPYLFGWHPKATMKDISIWDWLQKERDEVRDSLLPGGEIMDEDLAELLCEIFNRRVEDSATTDARLKLAAWKAIADPRSNPGLVQACANARLCRLVDPDKPTIRVRIPGSTYAQMLSVDSMALLGRTRNAQVVYANLGYGEIVWDPLYQVWVVENQAYLDNQTYNLGGCDGDDKFVQILRWRQGKLVLWTARNPMGNGEYAVFSVVGKPPVEVPANLTLEGVLPPQASEINQREKFLPSLPSAEKKRKLPKRLYAEKDWVESLRVPSQNPAGFLLLLSLWDRSYGNRVRCPFLPRKEDIVDSCVQTKYAEDFEFLKEGARKTLTALMNGLGHGPLPGKMPVEEVIWRKLANTDRETFSPLQVILVKEKRLRKSWWSGMVHHAFDQIQLQKKEVRQMVDVIRIRPNYLKLLETLPEKKFLEMATDRYRTMCSLTAYDGVPKEYKKFIRGRERVLPEGFEWMNKQILEQFRQLRYQFVKWGLTSKEALRVALAGMAYAAHHPSTGKTDHVLNRDMFFSWYRLMCVKLQEKKALSSGGVKIRCSLVKA